MPHMPQNFAYVSVGILPPLAQQGMVGPREEREAIPEDGRKRQLDVRTNPKGLGTSAIVGLPNLKEP